MTTPTPDPTETLARKIAATGWPLWPNDATEQFIARILSLLRDHDQVLIEAAEQGCMVLQRAVKAEAALAEKDETIKRLTAEYDRMGRSLVCEWHTTDAGTPGKPCRKCLACAQDALAEKAQEVEIQHWAAHVLADERDALRLKLDAAMGLLAECGEALACAEHLLRRHAPQDDMSVRFTQAGILTAREKIIRFTPPAPQPEPPRETHAFVPRQTIGCKARGETCNLCHHIKPPYGDWDCLQPASHPIHATCAHGFYGGNCNRALCFNHAQTVRPAEPQTAAQRDAIMDAGDSHHGGYGHECSERCPVGRQAIGTPAPSEGLCIACGNPEAARGHQADTFTHLFIASPVRPAETPETHAFEADCRGVECDRCGQAKDAKVHARCVGKAHVATRKGCECGAMTFRQSCGRCGSILMYLMGEWVDSLGGPLCAGRKHSPAPTEVAPASEDALEEVHQAWADEALAAQAAVSYEAVEAHIASLSWDWASAEARTLVAGNIRAFGAKTRGALEAAFDGATRVPPAPTPERAPADVMSKSRLKREAIQRGEPYPPPPDPVAAPAKCRHCGHTDRQHGAPRLVGPGPLWRACTECRCNTFDPAPPSAQPKEKP